MSVSLLHGDALATLRTLPDESFVSCFCDPPYGLKFMGKEWDRGVPSAVVWAEVLRVLKPGAVLLAFGGSRTHHRLFCAIEDAGFEIADSLAWIYGSGFPKSHNIGKAIDKAAGAEREVIGQAKGVGGNTGTGRYNWNNPDDVVDRTHYDATIPATDAAKIWDGYGTALKPAIEHICLARKPRNATYAQCAVEHGTAGLNIAGTRIGNNGTSAGRWPANLLLSHMPDCVETGTRRVKTHWGQPMERTTSEGTIQCKRVKHDRPIGYADADGLETVAQWECAEGCPVAELDRQADRSVSRFFYASKASRRERDAGLGEKEPKRIKGRDPGQDWRDVPYKLRPDMLRNPHPTVKPIALCEYLAKLIVPPPEYRDEAKLLVPFCGSGSEMIGALRAGWRNVTGIDISEEYLEIARLRIAHEQGKVRQLKMEDRGRG